MMWIGKGVQNVEELKVVWDLKLNVVGEQKTVMFGKEELIVGEQKADFLGSGDF